MLNWESCVYLRVGRHITETPLRMEQKEFTEYVISKIVAEFPQLKDFCTVKPNDIVDIDYKSKKGNVTFWLTTQDKEITIGFSGLTECDWHTHMSLFGANLPSEEIEVAIEFMKNLFSDKLNIIYSNFRGFFRIDNENETKVDEQEKGEIFETFKWTNL